jgi:hypothetical protein
MVAINNSSDKDREGLNGLRAMISDLFEGISRPTEVLMDDLPCGVRLGMPVRAWGALGKVIGVEDEGLVVQFLICQKEDVVPYKMFDNGDAYFIDGLPWREIILGEPEENWIPYFGFEDVE